MVKIQYNGTMKSVIVRKHNSSWNRGDIKKVSQQEADELLRLEGFSKIENSFVKKKVSKDVQIDIDKDKKETKEYIRGDING